MRNHSTVQPTVENLLYSRQTQLQQKFPRMTNYSWINNNKPGDVTAKKESIEKLKLIVHCPVCSIVHRNEHNAREDTVNRFLK